MKKTTALFAGIILPAVMLLCVAAGTAGTQEIEDCLACHEDRTLTKTDDAGKVHSLFVDRQLFKQSVHGKAGHTCVDCHEGVQPKDHPKAGIPDVQCGSCHSDIEQEYAKSNHGRLMKADNPYAPKCQDCHTAHAVMPAGEPGSSVNPDNLAATCSVCHEEEAKKAICPLTLDFIKGKTGPEAFSVTKILSPIVARVKAHGKVTMGCEYSTRRCGDCHFDVVKHGDTEAKPRGCSSCHEVAKSGIIFGRIHSAGIIKSPLLGILLFLGYLVTIAGIVFYVRKPGEKREDVKSEQ